MRQLRLLSPLRRERRQEVRCNVCNGQPNLCRFSICPKLERVRDWYGSTAGKLGTTIFGPSPPGAFVGEWGYPRVNAGPLIPALSEPPPDLLDSPEEWINHSLGDLLAFRLSLVRGKATYGVWQAPRPDRNLLAVQEGVMASRPADMEMELSKKLNLDVLFSPRYAPVGPSAPFAKVVLASNPAVPRKVDAVVYDDDLRADQGTLELYGAGVSQSQITRLLSMGLLGLKGDRKLVPTEWSITATDDIIGKALHREVLRNPELDEYRVFSDGAVANRVHILLLPTSWMFEALEAWIVGPDVWPVADHEFREGRRDYPKNLVGGYHAARLPVLEYLRRQGRQAGAIVFLEVLPHWIPLGVWRFREIARRALGREPFRSSTIDEALEELSSHLHLPLERWLSRTRILDFHLRQMRLDAFT